MKNLILCSIYLFSIVSGYGQSVSAVPLSGVTTESNSGSPISDLETLLIRDRECSEAANRSEMEKLWACWDEDAIMLGPGPNVEGIKAIKDFTTLMRKDPNFSISWTVQGGELSSDGRMGYTQGIGTIIRSGDNGQPVSSTNPYLCVWKKDQQGTWKIKIEK